MSSQVKVKFATDGKPSRGRPFMGTVKERSETKTIVATPKGDMSFSNKTGLALFEKRQYILEGYPKDEAPKAAAKSEKAA